MDQNSDKITFREVQQFKSWWLWIVVLGITGWIWYSFVQQIIFGEKIGTNPAPNWVMWIMAILFGIGLPLLFLTMKLIVEVHEKEIFIRYVPFIRRDIHLSKIKDFKKRTYSPIMEYGGWGIRGLWLVNKTAYNVSGNQGVELTLMDGKIVMIGSQRAQELETAIATAFNSIDD
jgi:hypothetical protein